MKQKFIWGAMLALVVWFFLMVFVFDKKACAPGRGTDMLLPRALLGIGPGGCSGLCWRFCWSMGCIGQYRGGRLGGRGRDAAGNTFEKENPKKMKVVSLIAMCLFICLCGCAEDVDGVCKYAILMGTTSSPAYDDALEGSVFCDANSLMVYSKDSFGAIAVYWDGKLDAEFSSGGIVLTRNSGHLAIKGNLKQELLVYVLERVVREKWKLCEKTKIPRGEINGFQRSMPF